MTRPTSTRARWGLLLVTATLGAGLVTAAAASFLGARSAVEAVVAVQAGDVVLAARRAIVLGGAEADDLSAELEELSASGVTYLALIIPPGEVLVEAGRRAAPEPVFHPPPRPEGRPVLQRVAGGERVRALAPLIPARGRRRWMGHMGERLGLPPGSGGALLLVEFEPSAADALLRRSRWTLLASIAAAALLLLAAGFFWRLARRAEGFAAELERDRRLAALGEMSAVLGHELRNPLASLKGAAQLLLEKLPADSAERAKAERVVAESLRLERLTGQVLDFVRTGRLEPAPTQVSGLLQAAVEVAGSTRIRLVADSAPGEWPLDRDRVLQALVNLLQNALEAGPAESEVELTAAREGDELVLRVADRGPGLVPGEEEQVFEPFYTRRVRGTGLGLAVARRVAEGHGGRATARNRAGGGAEFELIFPAVREG